MTLYVDSSALVKQYAYEPDAEVAGRILASDSRWVSSRLTLVEVRRALSRELHGRRLGEARTQFSDDWSHIDVIDPDELLCEQAADIAETTGLRTLDAVHLATAHRAGAPRISFVTFDRRQADAARSLGWAVLGA